MKMKGNRLGLFLTGAGALLLFGCASAKTQSWTNPDFKDHSIGKAIVVATFEDKILCGEYESIFAQRLLDYVPAASMHADLKNVDTLDKKTIENLLKENQVKTIIITHLARATDRSQVVPDGVSYVAYAGDYGSYYAYCSGYAVSESVDDFMELAIETTLFDVKSGRLIWSGRRSVYDFNSNVSNMKKVINDVIRDLEKDGMLK